MPICVVESNELFSWNYNLSVWVTMPERPKGVKDKVKRSERPPAKSQGLEGP